MSIPQARLSSADIYSSNSRSRLLTPCGMFPSEDSEVSPLSTDVLFRSLRVLSANNCWVASRNHRAIAHCNIQCSCTHGIQYVIGVSVSSLYSHRRASVRAHTGKRQVSKKVNEPFPPRIHTLKHSLLIASGSFQLLNINYIIESTFRVLRLKKHT